MPNCVVLITSGHFWYYIKWNPLQHWPQMRTWRLHKGKIILSTSWFKCFNVGCNAFQNYAFTLEQYSNATHDCSKFSNNVTIVVLLLLLALQKLFNYLRNEWIKNLSDVFFLMLQSADVSSCTGRWGLQLLMSGDITFVFVAREAESVMVKCKLLQGQKRNRDLWLWLCANICTKAC